MSVSTSTSSIPSSIVTTTKRKAEEALDTLKHKKSKRKPFNKDDSRALKKLFCFTANNPDTEFDTLCRELVDSGTATYLCYGKEVGASGTHHYQGAIQCDKAKRMTQLRKSLPSCHMEIAFSDLDRCITYCSKDSTTENPLTEYGVPYTTAMKAADKEASRAGERTEFEEFINYLNTQDNIDLEAIKIARCGMFARFGTWCNERVDHEIRSRVQLPIFTSLYGFQKLLLKIYRAPEQDRVIHFLVDKKGCGGKSLITKALTLTFPHLVQAVKAGKVADMAYYVRHDNKMILCDVPRTRQGIQGDITKKDLLPYEFFESVKNQSIASPKYHSFDKVFTSIPHMCVLTNHEPDFTKLTDDRYDIIHLKGDMLKFDTTEPLEDYFPEYIAMLKEKGQYQDYLDKIQDELLHR